ncbi:uncharacterized protein LOC142802933 [Rhipicephalus microplus]|uniref:uncharacterized protein LOC142802933 n=1 Tax=Rhipicephalus microplus TaxID=6941 RepID=UPI003F6D6A5D
MTRDDYSGRRLARAAALARHYGYKFGVFYVDASGQHHGGWYTAAVVPQNTVVNGLTFRTHSITHAEEIAIALAAADQDSGVIITDSRGACREIEQGYIPYLAYKFLQNSSYLGAPAHRTIIWAPAHTGLDGNKTADAAAHALTLRAPSLSPTDPELEPNPAYTVKKVTQFYQSGHNVYPKLCKGLIKAEEQIPFRLYTKTLLCPAIIKHFDPACTGKCPHCEENSCDIFHMVWACQKNPNFIPLPNTSRGDWEAALLGCSDLTAQRALVVCARAAADANGLPLEKAHLVFQTTPPMPPPSSGVPWIRNPPTFTGADGTDVEDWLTIHKRVNVPNKWDEDGKLRSLVFYLAGVVSVWYNNHESDFATLSNFETAVINVFGRPAISKLQAEQRLRERAQRADGSGGSGTLVNKLAIEASDYYFCARFPESVVLDIAHKTLERPIPSSRAHCLVKIRRME